MATRTLTAASSLPALTSTAALDLRRVNNLDCAASLPTLAGSVGLTLFENNKLDAASSLPAMTGTANILNIRGLAAPFVEKRSPWLLGAFAVCKAEGSTIMVCADKAQRLVTINPAPSDRIDILGQTMLPTKPWAFAAPPSQSLPVFVLGERASGSSYATLRAYSRENTPTLLKSVSVPRGTSQGALWAGDSFVVVGGDDGRVVVLSADENLTELAACDTGLQRARVAEVYRASDLDNAVSTAWRVLLFNATGASGALYELRQRSSVWTLRLLEQVVGTDVEGPKQLLSGLLLSGDNRLQDWSEAGELVSSTRYRDLVVNGFDIMVASGDTVLHTTEPQSDDALLAPRWHSRNRSLLASRGYVTIHADGWVKRINGRGADDRYGAPVAPVWASARIPALTAAASLTYLGLDPRYFNAAVSQSTLIADGSLVLAGNFTLLGSDTRGRIVKLQSSGIEDATFTTNVGTGASANNCFAFDAGDGILVTWDGTAFNGNTRGHITKLGYDGAEDATFVANIGVGLNNDVRGVCTAVGGDAVLVGHFSSLDGVTRNGIVRISTAGVVDEAFMTNVGSGISAPGAFPGRGVLRLSDGRLLVTGEFSNFNGATRNRAVMLYDDGTEDTDFYANLGTGFNQDARRCAQDSGGRLFIPGQFTALNGTARGGFVCLGGDGVVDAEFMSNFGSGFNGIAAQALVLADGSIVVCGEFTAVSGSSTRLAKISSNGAVDTTFIANLGAGFNGTTNHVIDDGSGLIVLGAFTTFNGNSRKYVARLYYDGTEDTAWYERFGR